jgi:ATP-dependent Clp protease adaptor protein ClpS
MAEPKKPGGGDEGGGKKPGGGAGQTVIEREPKLHKPKMWKVVLHNDDYTTMEFVVWVLQMVFQKDQDEAMALMLSVHQTGRGVAGVFTKDIAETKCNQVMELAEANAMPLLCTTEPD